MILSFSSNAQYSIFKSGLESRFIEEIKNYNEDYFFKNNLKVEFVSVKITNYNEINSQKMDSLLRTFLINKLLAVEVKISKLSYKDMIRSGIDYSNEAVNSPEYENYAKSIRKYRGQIGYKVQPYMKYIIRDMNGNHVSNHIEDAITYYFSNDFKIITVY